MGRYDELLAFIGETAGQFGTFRVVAVNPTDGTQVPITEIFIDDGHGEICLVSKAKADAANLVLSNVFSELQGQLRLHPAYSLTVSEWFEIDAEYTGRFDMPLISIEVDEQSQTVQLIY